MIRSKSFFLLLILFTWMQLKAQTIQPYENGPVHEAYVTPVSAELLLDAVEFEPPEPLNERIPKQLDIQAEWISGYWKWDLNANDFVWVSGVWRRPPPGHQWIAGFWKKYDQEWVRIPGYWSRIPEQNVDFISMPPPDSIDENMAPPPSSNYFWVGGHWYFMFDKHEYHWVSGHWEEFDSQWVLVPAHYIWRPGGYVYIPAYWDWPIEERGTAYASVIIDPDYRYRVAFEPILILKPEKIVKQLFLYYPDYLCFLHHHYHYHLNFWKNFCCYPPWWGWETWWGFTWHDHWALWWWYTHPGYPQPLWMTKEISSILPAPLSDLLSMFSYVDAPLIVTPNGVVSRMTFLHALNRVTEGDFPIVPDDEKKLKRIQELARPVSIDSTSILKPLGRRLPIDPNAVRPNVRKPVVNAQALSGVKVIREDLKPRIPFQPRIPSHRGAQIWREQESTPSNPPPVRRPTWTPKSPSSYPPVQAYPESNQRTDSDNRSWKPRHNWVETPVQRPPIHKPRNRRYIRNSFNERSEVYDHEDEDGSGRSGMYNSSRVPQKESSFRRNANYPSGRIDIQIHQNDSPSHSVIEGNDSLRNRENGIIYYKDNEKPDDDDQKSEIYFRDR